MGVAEKEIRLPDGRKMRFILKELPEDIDVDRLMQIDYSNLSAEQATLPTLMYKLGVLLAEMENEVRLSELNLRKIKAILADEAREEIPKRKNGKAATNDEVTEYYRQSPKYDIVNRKVSKDMMRRDIVQSAYWSMKSKQDSISNLCTGMSIQQFQEQMITAKGKTYNLVKIVASKDVI